MKKIRQLAKVAVLSIAVLMGSVGTTLAQFELGDNVLNVGVGIGNTLLSGYNGNDFSQTPAIGISFEHGTWELGDGVVSLGGYLGYKGYKNQYNYFADYTYTEKWTYTIVGVRGAYHFPLDNEKLDLYLGAMLSYNILSYKITSTEPGFNQSLYNFGSYGSGFGFSAFGGIRYYLSENVGLNAELGYGISFLTLGLSFKF